MMKAPYQYTWKNGIVIRSDRAVGFPIALQNDMIFADLLTGNTYQVLSIFKAKENDRDNLDMPEDVVQTFSIKPLSKEQLDALRERHKFQPDEQLGPGEVLAILESI
ncbi:MAG: hypothetical protein WB683_12635 [Candidatus Sulfotelmatobacter sp.]